MKKKARPRAKPKPRAKSKPKAKPPAKAKRKPRPKPAPKPRPGGGGGGAAVPGPIQHVVFFIKENHCFDNYFGTFPGANGMPMPRSLNPPPHDPNHRHDAWLTRQTTAVRQ